MTEVNSADTYYLFKANTEAQIKSMSDEILRLNNEIKNSNLAAVVDKYVARNGGDDDVSQFIFNQLKDTDTDIQSVPESVNSIRDNPSLQRFFSKADVPAPAPKRVFNQGWDY